MTMHVQYLTTCSLSVARVCGCRSWCERYGDVVLDVVKKEFKDHVGEMENMRKTTLERRYTSSKRWTTFEDDENCHPNRVSPANSKANSYF